MNTDLSFEQRAKDLVSRMTLEEKVSQMKDVAPAIDRLGIPAYNWWNEALHGVARSGLATVFPQAIGLAATFDDSLIFRMATVISDEARAKYQENIRTGRQPAIRRADLLVAQHQPLPRSALGTRPGNVRRGSVPHRSHGGPVHPWHAGRRSHVPQDRLHGEALRRPQRPRTRPPHLRRGGERARPARELSAALRGRHSRGRRLVAHVRLQPGIRKARVRERPAAPRHPARRVGLPRLRGLRLRRDRRHLPAPSSRRLRGEGGRARREVGHRSQLRHASSTTWSTRCTRG